MLATRWVPALALLSALAGPVGAAPDRTVSHYWVDPGKSLLRWELPATLHTVHGRVPAFRGSVDLEPGKNGYSIQSRIVVEAGAMTTGNRRRDRSMREKVLETDRFPEIVFELKRVSGDLTRLKSGESFTVGVTGELTVHGRAATVQLPIDVYVFADHVILAGSFPLHWRQHGLKDPSFGLVKVKEPMHVVFRLRAVPGDSRP